MQTWFILVWLLPVPTCSPQATHLRFSTNFVKNLFTTSEYSRNPFPLCSGNSQFKRQSVSWLQLNFWKEHKDFSPLEWIIQFDVPEWTLNRFASVCPRVVERAFDNEVLFEYLSLTFWNQTHIYIGPSCIFKMIWRDVSFQKAFSEFFLLVIDYTVIFWRVMTFEFEFQVFHCW